MWNRNNTDMLGYILDLNLRKSRGSFNFDYLMGPHIDNYFLPQDIDYLYYIATSLAHNSDLEWKYNEINRVMITRDWRRLGAGTNRVVYKSLENPYIVSKIAIDRVGMRDNPLEFANQRRLKPYCAKTFSLDRSGVICIAERVIPILHYDEFLYVEDTIKEIIREKIIGRYVMDDIGTEYFMNWGLRPNFGPVLLDYPSLFEIDVEKLYCFKEINGMRCNGEIDYTSSYGHLYCLRCGKIYYAKQLKKDLTNDNLYYRADNNEATVPVTIYSTNLETGERTVIFKSSRRSPRIMKLN